MSDTSLSSKENIRKAMLLKRSKLNPSTIEEAASALQTFLYTLLNCEQNRRKGDLTVMSYMSFRNEFPTHHFNDCLLSCGIRLLLPLTDEKFHIRAFAVNDLADLNTSSLGIAEPDPNKCPALSCEEPDLIIVPGIAFDRRGSRIGFGRGCYDRFLADRQRPALLIGAAYSFQVMEDPIPAEPADIPMHLIVTEKGIIDCREEQQKI